MESSEVVQIRMRRSENSIPWGFRMQGGTDYGTCTFIQKITSRGLAEKAGIRPGDGIVRIGDEQTNSLDHNAAKMEILRSGNDLNLVIKRQAVTVASPGGHVTDDTDTMESPSLFIGYTDPKVQSRSFKILQKSLNYSEPY